MVTTDKIWPPPPGAPIGVSAMWRLYPEFGPKETEGTNWGPFIRKVAAPFISPGRLATFAPGQKRAGLLLWCALTVCWAIYEELFSRALLECASQWKRIASAECSKLYSNLEAVGWTWKRGEPLPPAHNPQGLKTSGLPVPGDLVFYGKVLADGTWKIVHVDFYEAPQGAGDFDSVGGNTGHPVANRVDRVLHRGPEALARVLAYARLLW